MDGNTSTGVGPMTFREAVEGWADEREKLRYAAIARGTNQLAESHRLARD